MSKKKKSYVKIDIWTFDNFIHNKKKTRAIQEHSILRILMLTKWRRRQQLNHQK